ncbi:MAG: phosphatase PAP2 family protein [Clostridiales bacterium]|nr:phosphatase PAP2 family protein [Clostridiales bacterium]
MDFEIKIIEFLQAGRNVFFDTAFQIISVIGSAVGVIALCLFFLIFKKKLCFWYLFSYGFVYLAVSTIKSLVERPRPFFVVDTIANIGDAVTEFSFPSGHAACATAIAIFLGYFLFMAFKQKPIRICTVISCVLFVGLVCLSRMYLGKHFLTDVIGGVVVSALICFLGILLMRVFEKKRKKNENKNGNQ